MSELLKDEYPSIAVKLVDAAVGETCTSGSNRKVKWRCDHGHVFTASVYDMTHKGVVCPYCTNRKVLVGFNDFATTDPDLARMAVNLDDTKAVTRGSKKKLQCQCEHGHVWEVSPAHLVQGRKCPYCAHKKAYPGETDLATTRPDLAAQLVDKSLAYDLMEFSNKKVEWQCDVGHVWTASVASRAAGCGCPVCSGRKVQAGVNDLATTHPDVTKMLVNPRLAAELTAGSNKVVEWHCEHGHVWTASPNEVTRGHGCAVCAGMQVHVGMTDLWTTHPEIAAELADPNDGYEVTYGSKKKVKWVCRDNPSHVYEQAVQNHVLGHAGCPVCWAESSSSKGEQELCAYVEELVGADVVKRNDRTLLGGREVDIYIPSLNIAIEYNGTYWHSDAQGNVNGQYEKYRDCKDKNVQLIQVWDDDWNNRRDIVKSMVAAKLGCTDGARRIGARVCIPSIVDGTEAADFLNRYHIQGSVRSTYHFGLRDRSGSLVALLSVRSAQFNSRIHRNAGDWDVQRYATSGIVPGGFTKLLKFAESYIADTGEVINCWWSFSANDVSNGVMYRKSGFVLDGEVAPDYKYVGNITGGIRVPKERFQKSRFRNNAALLFEEGMTERELAKLNGLHRVYDAGKLRWKKIVE